MDLISQDHEIGTEDAMPLAYKEAFVKLWEDSGIQEAISKGHEYALHDNLE